MRYSLGLRGPCLCSEFCPFLATRCRKNPSSLILLLQEGHRPNRPAPKRLPRPLPRPNYRYTVSYLSSIIGSGSDSGSDSESDPESDPMSIESASSNDKYRALVSLRPEWTVESYFQLFLILSLILWLKFDRRASPFPERGLKASQPGSIQQKPIKEYSSLSCATFLTSIAKPSWRVAPVQPVWSASEVMLAFWAAVAESLPFSLVKMISRIWKSGR